MDTFTKVNMPLRLTNTPGGVWQIEKKRKVRDKKNKQQKNLKKEQRSREEDGSVIVDIEIDGVNHEECEDQTGYGSMKKKKSLCSKIDLKI